MATPNISPTGSSGIISNLFASLGAQAGNAAEGAFNRAAQQKMQDEQLYARMGLFAPVSVLKNVLGDVNDVQLNEYRNYALKDIEKIPISVGWTLWGELYPQLLDYDTRKKALAQANAGPAPEKIDEEWWITNMYDMPREDLAKKTGYTIGGPKGKKGDWIPFQSAGEKTAEKMTGAIRDLTSLRVSNPAADRLATSIYVNIDILNELTQKKQKANPQEAEKIEKQIKDILERNNKARQSLDSYARYQHLAGLSPEDRRTLSNVIGTSTTIEDYVKSGNYYDPAMNMATQRVITNAKAIAEEEIDKNLNKIMSANPDPQSAFEHIMRVVDQGAFGGLLQTVGYDVFTKSTTGQELRKKIMDAYAAKNPTPPLAPSPLSYQRTATPTPTPGINTGLNFLR